MSITSAWAVGDDKTYSYEAWIATNSGSSNLYACADANSVNSGSRDVTALFLNGAGVITSIEDESYDEADADTTTPAVNDGAWHHLVATCDGSNLNVYIDGSLAAGPTSVAGVAGTISQDRSAIGCKLGTALSDFFVGSIATVRVYSAALSGAQVSANYSAGVTAASTDSAASGIGTGKVTLGPSRATGSGLARYYGTGKATLGAIKATGAGSAGFYDLGTGKSALGPVRAVGSGTVTAGSGATGTGKATTGPSRATGAGTVGAGGGAPTVGSITPASGPAGTPVLIQGTGFTNDTTAVYFGAASAGTLFSVISQTCIVAYAPDASGTVDITVATPNGTSATSGYDQFTFAASPGPPGGGGGSAPTVTGLSPSTSADPTDKGGDVVTITGTGFTTAIAVFFGSIPVAFAVDSDTQITATSPSGNGTVDVLVWNSYGESTVSSADQFTWPPCLVPTISSFTPSHASDMAPVTITGTNFLNADGTVEVSGVFFSGDPDPLPAVFVVTSATSLVAYVPEHAISGPITVFGGGSYATSATFTADGSVFAEVDAAQASANGKNTIHYKLTTPGTTPNFAGDTWFQYGTGSLANIIIGQWIGLGGTSWQSVTIAGLVIANIDAGKITTGILSGIEIDGVNIYGGTIQTAKTGTRILPTSGDAGVIAFIGASGAEADIFTNGSGDIAIVAPAGLTFDSYSAIGTNCGLSLGGDLRVGGSIKPTTKCASGVSDDGIWVNDLTTAGRIWKLYMYGNQLYARYGSGGSQFVVVGP